MPNISQSTLRELQRKEKQLIDVQRSRALDPFARKFAENLALLASLKPYGQWSQTELAALDDAFGRCYDMKYLFISLLPSVEQSPLVPPPLPATTPEPQHI